MLASLCSLVLFAFLSRSDPFLREPSYCAPSNPRLESKFEVPVVVENGAFFARVRIDKRDAYVLIDTGSDRSVLWSEGSTEGEQLVSVECGDQSLGTVLALSRHLAITDFIAARS